MKKKCIKCGRELPIDCFVKSKEHSGGYTNICKECKKEYVRELRRKRKVEKEVINEPAQELKKEFEKKKKRIVVWSLFDSENATAKKLNKKKYHVICIGLGTKYARAKNFLKLDLSSEKCFAKLDKLPKPAVIIASPPCETWVTVSVGNTRNYKEAEKNKGKHHNLYWLQNGEPTDYSGNIKSRRLKGCATAEMTAKIIDRYKPKNWGVENPKSSKIFEYLKNLGLLGYKNKCTYISYDFDFPLKPTIIYSNKKMMLRYNEAHKKLQKNFCGGNKKSNSKVKKENKNYEYRSRVPIELYKDIMRQMENEIQYSLF